MEGASWSWAGVEEGTEAFVPVGGAGVFGVEFDGGGEDAWNVGWGSSVRGVGRDDAVDEGVGAVD